MSLDALRKLMDDAFDGEFTDEDWGHTIGGTHVMTTDDTGAVLAHASVVQRTLHLGDRAWSVGYVEAVAVTPDRQGQGLGAEVMRTAASVIADRYELGALSTGAGDFYERLGWQRWRGPTSVRLTSGELQRTEDEDGGIYVLVVGEQPDLDGPIACEERPGEDW